MKIEGFAQRLEAVLEYAYELAGLWTNTPIAAKIDTEINALKNGVENGNAEEVTYELFPSLKETLTFAEAEYQRVEG
jgi:hypothetical protein